MESWVSFLKLSLNLSLFKLTSKGWKPKHFLCHCPEVLHVHYKHYTCKYELLLQSWLILVNRLTGVDMDSVEKFVAVTMQVTCSLAMRSSAIM